MHFGSDNAAPAHPNVLAALARANDGYAMSYGTEPAMDRVRAQIQEIFEAPEAAIYLVATGTTANVLSLASYTRPWQTIYCHREAHAQTDECGAPEFYTGGARLTLLDGPDGKFDAKTLAAALGATNGGFVHSVQPGPVTITNTSECGTIYQPSEIAAISDVCRAHDLALHMDGARFANALVATGCSPAEMTWKAGVDVMSFGGTKNGLLGVEAVVLFDPAKAWEFELRRKRGGHLFSKHRYLSAQMEAYLADGLWLDLARAANAAAANLAGRLRGEGASFRHPPEANAVFACLPRAAHRRALGGGAHYYLWPFDQSLEGPDDEVLSARLMCSWCTTEADITSLITALRGT